MTMTPDDIEHVVHEELMYEYEPAVVRSKTDEFLASLDDSEETAASVYYQARKIADARHREFEMRDGDMERVVAVFDAVLDPMIRWLEEKRGFANARKYVFDQIDDWRI